MNVTVSCKCGKQLRVGIEHAGKTIACRACGARSVVPQAPAPAPDEALAASLDDDVEVKLQDLPASRVVAEEPTKPVDLDLDDKPAPTPGKDGYGFGGGNAGTGGDFASVAVIELASPASCLAYGCKGDWALAGLGSEALLINIKQRKLVSEFTEHTCTITALALSPTEPLALSADEQGVLCYWQLAGSKSRQTISAHDGAIRAIALSTDATLALSGGTDGCIRLWNLASGKRRDLEHADWGEEPITTVQFSRDGARFLAGGGQGNVSLWKADVGKRLRRFENLGQPIASVHLSDDGQTVTAATQPAIVEGKTQIAVSHWEARTGELLNRVHIDLPPSPWCIVSDRTGSHLLAGGGADAPWLGLWCLRDGTRVQSLDGIGATPHALAVAPKNHRVLVALASAKLQLFKVKMT